MKKRRRRLASSIDMSTFTDHSITKTIMEYTINLLNRVNLDEKILTQSINCLSVNSRSKLIDSLFPFVEKENDEMNSDRENHDDAAGEILDPRSLSSTIMRAILRKRSSFNMKDVRKYLIEFLNDENNRLKSKETAFDRKLQELGNIFRLSTTDLIVLRLIFLVFAFSIDSLNEIFDYKSYHEFTRLASFATGLSSIEIRKSLNTTGMLVSSNIIESIDHTGRNFISIDDSIAEYLTGISEKSILERFIKYDDGKCLKVEDFFIPVEDTLIIKDILNNGQPCSILLYGIPGTGKTEYARSIALQCSERVYTVRYGDQGAGSRKNRSFDSDSRLLALRVAINTISENGGILIVDEADFLLNTISSFFESGSPEKGWLNDLLDNCKARIIWITNKIGSMEESTLRRFSYSLCFKKFNKEQRVSVWNNILKRNPLKKYISSDLVTELSVKYEVNAGAISSSLNALKQINAGRVIKPEEIQPLLENLLTKHSILLNADIKNNNKLVKLTDKYDLSFLNTDIDINAVVHSVKKFNDYLNNPLNGISNINLLLWGESGTGKTEFAKFIATQTGMGLIIKRSSDLMNMYVGETEKLIRKAFREAEEKKSILFIDEADTFFGSRDRAKASWEISHTNEFLVQMENFNGILICCTNLLEIFDTASMRRFNWKVRFSPVLNKMRIPLYEKYFINNSISLTPKQKKRVSSIEYLTPGHVKAVYQRMMFADVKIQDHDSIIDEVEKEASYMKIRSPKRMGF